MKSLFASLVVVALSASFAFGQAATIHATTTYHPDGTRSNTVVDTEKRSAEETVLNSAGKTVRKVTYLMDDRDQYFGSITYDPAGNILYRTSYKRDAAGRVDEESISSADGQLMRRRVYTYGADNKVTSLTEYDGNGNAIVMPRKKAAATPFPAKPAKKK